MPIAYFADVRTDYTVKDRRSRRKQGAKVDRIAQGNAQFERRETVMSNEAEDARPGKCVVLIGDLVQEGVTTKIKSMGHHYVQKILQGSGPANWSATTSIIRTARETDGLLAVFAFLNLTAILQASDEFYAAEWNELVSEFVKVKAIIYVYESSLANEFEDLPIIGTGKEEYVERIQAVIANMTKAGITLLPFRKRPEITISIQQFLDEVEGGVLLRLYVPNMRYQGDQLNGFLRLLENYLKTVEKKTFTIDQRKTDHGLIYVFSSKQDIKTMDDLTQAIARFEAFMEICEQDVGKAKEILRNSVGTSGQDDALIGKYARDYRRLKLDTKHEFEQKILALRHRWEGELLDTGMEKNFMLPANQPPSNFFQLAGNNGIVNINYLNNSIDKSTEFGQIINGDVIYNEQDSLLLNLFEKHAERLEAITLKSSLDEVKDPSAPQAEKKTAKQKITGFLYKAGSALGEATVKGLASYLEATIRGMAG
jgi:hypothetical protein